MGPARCTPPFATCTPPFTTCTPPYIPAIYQ